MWSLRRHSTSFSLKSTPPILSRASTSDLNIGTSHSRACIEVPIEVCLPPWQHQVAAPDRPAQAQTPQELRDMRDQQNHIKSCHRMTKTCQGKNQSQAHQTMCLLRLGAREEVPQTLAPNEVVSRPLRYLSKTPKSSTRHREKDNEYRERSHGAHML